MLRSAVVVTVDSSVHCWSTPFVLITNKHSHTLIYKYTYTNLALHTNKFSVPVQYGGWVNIVVYAILGRQLPLDNTAYVPRYNNALVRVRGALHQNDWDVVFGVNCNGMVRHDTSCRSTVFCFNSPILDTYEYTYPACEIAEQLEISILFISNWHNSYIVIKMSMLQQYLVCFQIHSKKKGQNNTEISIILICNKNDTETFIFVLRH